MRLLYTTLLLSLLFAACAKQAEVAAGDAEERPAQRIVVLGPSTTANLYAMGQGSRVVGVSDYCTVPEAEEVARVGGLADPSLERILALQPDLVLVQGKAPRLEDLCRTAGIELKAFTTDTLEEWYAEVDWLGHRLHAEQAGADLLTRMREGLAALGTTVEEEAVVAQDSSASGPTVLLVVFRRDGEASGMTVAGDQGFLHQLLLAAGGRNALDGSGKDYFDLNEERLIRVAPDRILEFHTEDLDAETLERLDAEALRIWRRDFPSLPAVVAGKVRTLQGKDLLLPGPSMLGTAEQMRGHLESK